MKKVSVWFSLLLIFGLALSACTGDTQTTEQVPLATMSPEATGAGEVGLGETGTPGGDQLTTPTIMQVTEEPAGTASPEATTGLENGTPGTGDGLTGTGTPAAGGELQTGTPSAGGTGTTRTPVATAMGTEEAALPDTGLFIQTNPARFSDLLTYTIVDDSGNAVGSIQDMVLDLRARKIRWVALSLEEASGDSDSASDTGSSVLVPWRALELDLNQASGPGMFSPEEKSLTLTVDPSVLSNAPTIDLASLNFLAPDFEIETWDRAQSSYWAQQGGVDVDQGDDLENTGPSGNNNRGSTSGAGSSNAQTTPAGTPVATAQATTSAGASGTVTATQASSQSSTGTPSATTTSGNNGQGQGQGRGLPGQGLLNNQRGIERMLLATDLINMPISGLNGDGFATVNDAIVDAQNGRVLFLVLSDLQGLDLGEDMFVVVPMIAFRQGTPGQGLVLPFDTASLSALPSLTQEELNDPGSTVWQDNLWNFWRNMSLPDNEPNGQ